MAKFLQIAVIVATFGVSNATFAEQSGGFLGLEVGYGAINTPFENSTTTNIAIFNDITAGEMNGGGVDIGIVGGYKQFFNPYFGLRYYGNVNFILAKLKPKLTRSATGAMYGGTGSRSTMLINYALNIDMLVNFIVREKNRIADFGAFLGVGLGGNHWSGKGVNEIDEFIDIYNNGVFNTDFSKTKRNFFDLSLNVGLRTNIAYNHGLELALKMSLLKNVLVDGIQRPANHTTIHINFHTKVPSYNITLRYTYSFGTPKKVVRKVIKKRVKQQSVEYQ